jgi:hypothetical protein
VYPFSSKKNECCRGILFLNRNNQIRITINLFSKKGSPIVSI